MKFSILIEDLLLDQEIQLFKKALNGNLILETDLSLSGVLIDIRHIIEAIEKLLANTPYHEEKEINASLSKIKDFLTTEENFRKNFKEFKIECRKILKYQPETSDFEKLRNYEVKRAMTRFFTNLAILKIFGFDAYKNPVDAQVGSSGEEYRYGSNN